MIDIFILLLLNSFAILGVHQTTNEGMIFEKLATWCEYNLPEWLNKPLWACPYCMASIHSTYFFVPYAIITEQSFVWWPIYIFTLCGFNIITYNASEILRRYS